MQNNKLPLRKKRATTNFRQPPPHLARTKLQEWVSKNNYIVEEVSTVLGYTAKYMTYVINGSRRPSVNLAKKIEALTEGYVTAAELLRLR